MPAPRAPGWGLTPGRVPPPPSPDPFIGGVDLLGWLRWSIAVMDADDPKLGLAATCLAHVALHGAPLPEGPREAVDRLFVEVLEDWLHDALDCQEQDGEAEDTDDGLNDPEGSGDDLQGVDPEGRA